MKLPENLKEAVAKAKEATASAEAARVALASLDLTSLNDTDTPEVIDALAAKADQGELGRVAATCVYPQFLRQTFNATAAKGINRATVINFPGGEGAPEETFRATRAAIAAGANEIDIVLDYNAFLKGDVDGPAELLLACRAACGNDAKLKVILESAAFDNAGALYSACGLALDCGADFLKTSTGKSGKGGASLEAASVMLLSILDNGGGAGVKISGGVKTVADAAQYIALAENMMGKGWIAQDTFRIGASGVLTDILKTLGKTADAPRAKAPEAYY